MFDGTKLKASASLRQSRDRDDLEKEIERIKEQVRQMIEASARIDEIEEQDYPDGLPRTQPARTGRNKQTDNKDEDFGPQANFLTIGTPIADFRRPANCRHVIAAFSGGRDSTGTHTQQLCLGISALDKAEITQREKRFGLETMEGWTIGE